MTLQELFIHRLKLIYPERYGDILQALSNGLPTAFYINRLKGGADFVLEKLSEAGITFTPVDKLPCMYTIPKCQRKMITRSQAVNEGLIYMMNPSSRLPVMVLAPLKNESILDMTAAPGGKTIQMAAMTESGKNITALEMVKNRFFKLKANLERTGAENVRIILKDASTVWKYRPESFDKILLDAPCSTEALINPEDPDGFVYWSENKIKEMNRKQRKLLYAGIRALKPGGRLVYSTCTFSPEENELPVQRMIRIFGDAISIKPIELPVKNIVPGLSEWKGKKLDAELTNCLRILPDGIFEGFFICSIRKIRTTEVT